MDLVAREASLTRSKQEMVMAAGRLCQMLGFPKSAGQIYGLLYLSPRPLSLDDMAGMLQISKASASNGTRQLSNWGVVRQVWVQGERRDYFEAVADLGALVAVGYQDFFKPRMNSSAHRLEKMEASLDQELSEGLIDQEDFDFCHERIKRLSKLQRKMESMAPLVKRLI